MSAKKVIANLFNPHQLSKHCLIENFVIRHKLFNKIYKELLDSSLSENDQHLMLIGNRGTGKTTMLLRLKYELEKEASFSCIALNEEEYGIHSLLNLWDRLADLLDEQELFVGIAEEIEDYEDADKTLSLLCQRLRDKKQKLLIFIDNIGDLFDKLSKIERHRLREIMIIHSELRFITATSRILEETYDYHEPFFDYFSTYEMKPLRKEEAYELIRSLGQLNQTPEIDTILDEYPERLESLRRLTGNIPRTLALLFEVFVDNLDGNSLQDLDMVMDRVTPLYKNHMDNLSNQQQKIVDAVALHWAPCATKEISAKTGLESKAVSAQLRQLCKASIIDKIETNTKNHLYQISERFFNIWYLMRCGRKKDRKRIIGYINFCIGWFSHSKVPVTNCPRDMVQEENHTFNLNGAERITNSSLRKNFNKNQFGILTKKFSTIQEQNSPKTVHYYICSFLAKAQYNTVKKFYRMSSPKFKMTYKPLWEALHKLESSKYKILSPEYEECTAEVLNYISDLQKGFNKKTKPSL